ncbi:MAG: response regulator transcription factor [Actinomycetota bacterium]|nr:response regulator transcription factor [Actinomycetota bacterium]
MSRNHAATNSTQPIRVLVADDHNLFAEAVTLVLVAEGLEVIAHAPDGDDAVRLARTLRPDVVLMDVHMPGMDGIEATRRIRAELPELPVLTVSSSTDPEDVRAAAGVGATAYIVKDCPSRELIDAIRAATVRQVAPLCGGGAAPVFAFAAA